MSGIKIGDVAVVAANSHVMKDIEPYTLVGGMLLVTQNLIFLYNFI